MVCRARGARRPLFRRSQFHAGAALTARKALDASALAARAARTNERGHGGGDEQMFGAKEQVPDPGPKRLTSEEPYRQRGAFLWRCQLARPRCGVLALPVFHRPLAGRVERKLNMSWHHPDLYFFLCLLAGLAAFLAIIYECIQKFRRRKKYLKNTKPLDGLQRDRPARPTEERASKRPSDFSRLCESIEDLPPKEQESRLREHFGIFGGARPAEGRGRKGKRP